MSNGGGDDREEQATFIEIKDGEVANGVVVADLDGEEGIPKCTLYSQLRQFSNSLFNYFLHSFWMPCRCRHRLWQRRR